MKLLCNLLFAFSIIITGYGQTAEDYYNMGIEKQSKSDWVGSIENFSKAIEIY